MKMMLKPKTKKLESILEAKVAARATKTETDSEATASIYLVLFFFQKYLKLITYA